MKCIEREVIQRACVRELSGGVRQYKFCMESPLSRRLNRKEVSWARFLTVIKACIVRCSEWLSFDNKLSGTAEFSLRLYFCDRGEGFFYTVNFSLPYQYHLCDIILVHHVKEIATMKLTGAQIIMECLLEQHVDTVFGIRAVLF